MLKKSLIYFFGCIFFFEFSNAQSERVDTELEQSLKIEANHNLNRLKSLKSEKSNQKVFDNEREKGLSSFLEDQEKWDLSRERGLAEYRKQKKTTSPQEGGPEYLADQKEKQKTIVAMEKNRQIQVRTRNQVFNKNEALINELEIEELGLNQNRPRYSLRKRGQNRWVKNSSQSGSSKTSSGPAPYSPPPVFDDFPPPPVTDYQPIPVPMENFEEIPPPPPPIYEGYGNSGTPFDSGFGEVPPPPPPPPIDFDF
ncbi:MAG: hypothetical protein H7328_01375 [Bdellovibrio sp.]|nr:hypothetical protein [Bdellovibrio sp.]